MMHSYLNVSYFSEGRVLVASKPLSDRRDFTHGASARENSSSNAISRLKGERTSALACPGPLPLFS